MKMKTIHIVLSAGSCPSGVFLGIYTYGVLFVTARHEYISVLI